MIRMLINWGNVIRLGFWGLWFLSAARSSVFVCCFPSVPSCSELIRGSAFCICFAFVCVLLHSFYDSPCFFLDMLFLHLLASDLVSPVHLQKEARKYTTVLLSTFSLNNITSYVRGFVCLNPEATSL